MAQRRDDPTSHEVDRHVDDQPVRDDLIDPADIDPEDGLLEETEEDLDDDREERPPIDELPETQGYDTLHAERMTEDGGQRHPLSDDERRT